MIEKQGKWEFLRPIANQILQDNPYLTTVAVAEIIKEQYNFNLQTEQLRKILSRLLAEQDPKEPLSALYTPKKISVKKLHAPVLHTKINKPGTYLVLGCWHIPFHNNDLTKRVYDLMDQFSFDGLILNGDFLDCNSLSGHDRGKFTAVPGLTLNQEYKAGTEVLDSLLSLLSPTAEKVYMYGNHENRYQRFVADMQNAKTPPPSPTEGLSLHEKGFTVVESYESGYITLGHHLDVLHGIYYNTHCSKTHIDRFRSSVLFAHTHRIQSYIEGHTGGFNIGWGGDVNSRAFGYADRGTKASWQNGFATVTIDEHGRYYTQQIVCNDSRFAYGGKQY